MAFFDELKRRNVFRVGIAYAVAAWVILQLTDVVGEILELPPWGGKLILVVILAGFIPALIFAWAFELTPEGIKREHEVDRTQSIAPNTGKKLNSFILVLLAVAVAYLLVDKFYIQKELANQAASISAQATADGATETLAGPELGQQSIAVLPFQNRSRLEEDDFFVQGVHDDLLTNLARISDLKVISRTSVLRYQDTEKPIPEIAGELGVATVMEGAVQRSGNTVRINVQLIDAQTDEHLWAEIFDRQMTADNLFAIQSEISERIAEALKATLSPEEQNLINERPTENLAAYSAFSRGRQLQAERTSSSLQSAMAEYERAVELDPDYALAWVGIAETAMLLQSYSTLPPTEAYQKAQEAVARALSLNNRLGEAYLSQAEYFDSFGRTQEAEEAYVKAIELSPGYATAYQWYANFLLKFPARYREALEISTRARELDPLSSIIHVNHIEKLIALGLWGQADQEFARLIELDPGFPGIYNVQANAFGQTGRFDEQVLAIQKSIDRDPGRVLSYLNQAFAYLHMGDTEQADELRAVIEEIDDQHWSVGWADAMVAISEGNSAAALESFNWVISKRPEPLFNAFGGFIHLMDKDYQRAMEKFQIAEPRYFDRTTWREAIERDADLGCSIAATLQQANREEMSQDLVEMILAYLEDELPGYVDDVDRFGYSVCYAVAGNYEKSLDYLEIIVEHGHIQYWWAWTQFPFFDPVRGDPRWIASMEQIQQRVARQRQNLEEGTVGARL